MGIPWKIKRKNQESHGDDMPCVMQNEGVPKEAASCDIKTKKNTDKRSEATKLLVGTLLCEKLQLFENTQIGQHITKKVKEIWQ